MQSSNIKRKKTTPGPHVADRVPPQALDAERTVLGSMLIDSVAVEVALEFLTDDCFYSEAHSRIFTCMRELSGASTPVDIITVTDRLRRKDWLEEVGAEAYLSELAENVATSGNIRYYASIIKEKATLRQLITVAGEITTDCFTDERDAQEILDEAEDKIFGIAESRIKDQFESVGQMLPRVLEEMHGYASGGMSGIPTGFKDLDQLTTGLHKGDLVIVGGRPSMGKTAFCLSVALHAAIKAGHPTAIFSLEMTKSQILQRLLCAEARINMHTLRSGKLNRDGYDRLKQFAQSFYERRDHLFIDDTSGITVLELKAKARRLKKQHNIELIIIDYLQLMTPGMRTDSMQQDIAQISRALKGVAKDLDVPVVALSQLNRSLEKRTDNRPQLSDLRESGAIEQDADVVMFVFREEVYKKDDPALEGLAEILVKKQRNGPIDDVKVAFVKEFAKFENLSQRSEF